MPFPSFNLRGLGNAVGGAVNVRPSNLIPDNVRPGDITVRPGDNINLPEPTITRPIDTTPAPGATRPIDTTPAPGVTPAPTAPGRTGNGLATGVVGVAGIGAAFLPMLLNSPALSGAINGATQVGTVAVIADTIKDVAGPLISSITDSPVNMGIFAVAGGAVLYLLFK